MFTAIYVFAMLPVVGGLLYLLAVVRMWRTSHGLSLVMLLFWPAGLYALVRHWSDPENNIRIPMLASLGAFALWWGLVAWGLTYQPPPRGDVAVGDSDGADDSNDGEVDGLQDKLRTAIALANLPLRGGRIELADAQAAIEVPAHFHFVDRTGLLATLPGAGNGLGERVVGWLVHDSVRLADDDAWFVEVEWYGDGYIAENAAALKPADALLADARRVDEQLAERAGETENVHLERYAEVPALDAGRHIATWVEEFVPGDAGAHTLDCYAIRLGRHGALVYSISEVARSRQELCLRTVRLAAARTEFATRQGYADHSAVFDHAAKYDLAALVTGAQALLPQHASGARAALR